MVKFSQHLLVTLALVLAWVATIVMAFWALGAVWFRFPFSLGPIFASCGLVALIILYGTLQKKTLWLAYVAGAVTSIWLVLQLQQPSHDRIWADDQSELSRVYFDEDQVTITNFRHSEYRSESDFDVHRSDFTFDLTQLDQVWFLVQHFTPQEGLAHVMLAFEVKPPAGPPEHFAISVEIRRELDEAYSPIAGLYREYELNYVFGDERDLIGVRTVMRPDDRVFMYPVNATPDQVQRLFNSISKRANQIGRRPEFYHTVLNNCMNGILRHTDKLTSEEINWFDPQILMPGYSDHYAFQNDLIGRPGQSFEALKKRCRIDERARDFGISEGFSQVIRDFGPETIEEPMEEQPQVAVAKPKKLVAKKPVTKKPKPKKPKRRKPVTKKPKPKPEPVVPEEEEPNPIIAI